MINLFETFDANTKKIYQSMKRSGINHPTVVIEDDGFLPEGVLSPYQFFTEFKTNTKDKPLYFNEVNKPLYWEIDGNNHEAQIKDMGNVKAHIKYKKNYKHRIVQSIEWLDQNGQVRAIEFYNQFGVHYKTKVFGGSNESILTTYFNRDHQPIIYENHVTNDYIIKYKGKEHFFSDKTQYIIFYLKNAFERLDSFVINSLSFPFIAVYQLGVKGKDYLIWQENTESQVPGNMLAMLSSDTRNFDIIVPDSDEYMNLTSLLPHEDRIHHGGYVYQYLKEPMHNHHILIVTNSDQLHDIDTIAKALPNHYIHIAAITEMSSKLLSKGEYDNIRLYPSIKRSTLVELYKICSIYLDIHYGSEVLDSVKGAFDYNMLIIGFEHTAHNKIYTEKQFLAAENDTEYLIELILNTKESEKFYHMMARQKKHGNEISEAEFAKQFNLLKK
ncbi:accessory Sec system glycosylation chaperone GtfB [Abyssicoccus albus]|uniref:UDP-N-acetylglucosamine--peptide N-acetylglucosaminyltransferase stabilizing protein GtfB n=1 Tax=Abyssicoccus albus TaxID=1817405 RepID=A0A3N5BNP1_9BACL|nr:accessory Sec system glycosylation chaperone GtfB [Abyssicoccus albus]RPF56700.1 accessory Sec system glycosyltransferase GtfB [Abyssicoccus albus]